MKVYTKAIYILMVLILTCFSAISILADDEPAASPKPATITNQDTLLAQQLSTAYSITVTPQEIADLRVANSLGYGGIAMLYGLANTSGKTIGDIIAMRQEDMGWGDIAKSLGLKVSDIMKKGSSVLKAAKMNNEAKNLQNEVNNKPSNKPDETKNNQDKSNNQNTQNNQNTGKNTDKGNNSNKK